MEEKTVNNPYDIVGEITASAVEKMIDMARNKPCLFTHHCTEVRYEETKKPAEDILMSRINSKETGG